MPQSLKRNDSDLWTDDTLCGLLAERANLTPDAPAALTSEETLNYGRLAERVDSLARALSELGLGPGDGLGMQLPNCVEFLVTLLAASRIGAVTSTIHMPLGPSEAVDILRHSEAKLVLAPAGGGGWRLAEGLLEQSSLLPRLAHVVTVGRDGPPGTLSFAELASGGGDRALPAPPKAIDPYVMLFTSGTSANPKSVRTDYRRFLANARVNYPEKAMDAHSVMLSCAPFSHLFGLYSFHLTLYAGGATALMPTFSPPVFVEGCARFAPSHIFLAPAHIAACRVAGLLSPEHFSSVKYMVVSGALAGPDIYFDGQKALANGRIAQLWGMTETQCGMFTRPDEPVEAAAAGAGRPSAGNEVRVCAGDGADLPSGEEGELQIRGASIFNGYHNNDAINAESFTTDGWFRTGDLAIIAADGAVTVTGRQKDLINRGGVKINPTDVEEAIDRHPEIVQSAIVPMPDSVLGERACCFAVAHAGANPSLADIAGWLERENVAKLKWPERLVLVDELPLTPTRKVIKGRLQIPDEE